MSTHRRRAGASVAPESEELEESEEESESESETDDEYEGMQFTCRSSRGHRTLEEKLEHGKYLNSVHFQNWAMDTYVTGQNLPMPSVSIHHGELHPRHPLGRARTLEVKHERRPSVLPLKADFKYVPMPGRPIDGHTQWSLVKDPAEREGGDVQTFVAWQNDKGRSLLGVPSEISQEQQRFLQSAVLQRANNQCMPLYVDSNIQRTQLRRQPSTPQSVLKKPLITSMSPKFGASSPRVGVSFAPVISGQDAAMVASPTQDAARTRTLGTRTSSSLSCSSPVSCPKSSGIGGGPTVVARQAVVQQANRFDTAYGMAQATLQGHLTFQPLQRSHTADVGKVHRCLH